MTEEPRSVVDRLNEALRGRYRIEGKIGEGGMATVYRADDAKHGRPVAVKVLKAELSAALDAERFLAEIRTTANLQHPHILPLFDSGEADGLLFYVMPSVSGESLRELLEREGPLPVDDAVRMAAAVADALEHAHGRGVLHRDLKPSNVLISDGEPLLADFGIALAIRDEGGDRLTRTGSSLGTPGYMSPEQAAGERGLDARSDIYSLGALTYEMLTGQPPFGSASLRAALARVLTEDPREPSEIDPAIPTAVSRVVAIALSREPEDRHASAGAFARDLRAAHSASLAVPRVPHRRALWPVVSVVAVALVLGGLWLRQTRQERWARVEALPEIQRLLGAGETADAFALASRATGILPGDPALADLYDAASVQVDFTSEPPGATVWYRAYDPEDTLWTAVGPTPATDVDLPEEELLIRFELDGHHPFRASFAPTQGSAQAVLVPVEDDAMVRVPASSYAISGEAVDLEGFWIDAHEVTNAEYRAFLASAIDWSPVYWVEPLVTRGIAVDPERMRAELVDRTGRPGPAGWELSRPPEGRDAYPVQGVSWFEAVAYCAHRGKELPTYYHWKAADGGQFTPWDGLLQHANLADGSGPVPVGTVDAYSVRGVSDMAGNVREWVWNAAGDDRYVLGGSWESPSHLYTSYDATDPWSRSLENGIRCARYDGEVASGLTEPIDLPIYDFTGFEPVDDATFAAYAAFYEYDRAELDATRVVVDESAAWTRERVELDAAYLDERLPVHLFLPKNARPPYQAVVYFPGSAAFGLSSSENVSEMSQLMFVPESGRALLYPVLKGTYERRHERPSRGMAERRQRYVWLVQDIMRTVDLVEERPDLDEDRVAYVGMSFGAELAVPVALEKRFRALVLIGGALDPAWRGGVPDEAAPWHFVSRITTPTLLINGRWDFMHPYEEGQVPFFEMIDVPEDDKEFVVLPTGHVPPNNEVITHALRWLDERLGPVPLTTTGG